MLFRSAPYALTQIHPRTSGSVDDAPKLSPAFTFITRRGFTPEHLHTKTTPWSVFQDGSLMTITPASLHECANLSPPQGIAQWAITLPEELRSPGLSPPARTDAGLGPAECTGEEHRTDQPGASLVTSASLSTISRAV